MVFCFFEKYIIGVWFMIIMISVYELLVILSPAWSVCTKMLIYKLQTLGSGEFRGISSCASRHRFFIIFALVHGNFSWSHIPHLTWNLLWSNTIKDLSWCLRQLNILSPPTIYNPSWVASGNMINMILESERRFFLSPRTISKSLPDSSIISIAIIFVTCKYLAVTERKSTFGLHVEDVMSVD